MKPRRSEIRVDFPAVSWHAVRGGGAAGRMKKHAVGGGRVVRVLEMDPKWNEREWCKKAHDGYVLSGRLRLDFESDSSPVEIGKGQGFSIPEGCAHKASCRRLTRMFIVG